MKSLREMSVAALVDANHYSSADVLLVSACAIAGVDHFHSTIEVLALTSQVLAELEPMDVDPDHLCLLFCVEEDQGQEDDPAESDPLYVDSSDIEQAMMPKMRLTMLSTCMSCLSLARMSLLSLNTTLIWYTSWRLIKLIRLRMASVWDSWSPQRHIIGGPHLVQWMN